MHCVNARLRAQWWPQARPALQLIARDLACRLLKLNEKGSVPVVKDLATEEWVTSSDVFVDLLEDEFPEPPLGRSDSAPDACVAVPCL